MTTVETEALTALAISVAVWLRARERVIPFESIEREYQGRHTGEELQRALALLEQLGIAASWGTGWFVRRRP